MASGCHYKAENDDRFGINHHLIGATLPLSFSRLAGSRPPARTLSRLRPFCNGVAYTFPRLCFTVGMPVCIYLALPPLPLFLVIDVLVLRVLDLWCFLKWVSTPLGSARIRQNRHPKRDGVFLCWLRLSVSVRRPISLAFRKWREYQKGGEPGQVCCVFGFVF